MSIKSIFFYLAISIVSVLLILVYLFVALKDDTDTLKDIQQSRYQMQLKADELRQSSDDLSRLANKYVITGNEQYKKDYQTVLSIRNGRHARPQSYSGVYWDLTDEFRRMNHPFAKKESLRSEMAKLPYLAVEIAFLNESELNSNKLVNLEIEAFNAMAGIFRDTENHYTVKGDKDQQRAIGLLNSPEYDLAKNDIMLPIDLFLRSLSDRTRQDIYIQNQRIEARFLVIYQLLAMFGVFLLFTIVLIKRKVLMPVSYLTNTMLAYQMGETSVVETVYYDDEIGLLSKQFFAMRRKLADDYEAIRLLSLTDPLTGIGNRRSFFEVSESFLKLANRDNRVLSVILFDIDFFKKVNDVYGHLVGDDILKYLTSLVASVLKDIGVFSRFGGEEFMILLPMTGGESAFKLAEKIRKTVADEIYKDDENEINIFITLGVSTSCSADTQMRTIVQRADKALYEGKENGRNCVVMH